MTSRTPCASAIPACRGSPTERTGNMILDSDRARSNLVLSHMLDLAVWSETSAPRQRKQARNELVSSVRC